MKLFKVFPGWGGAMWALLLSLLIHIGVFVFFWIVRLPAAGLSDIHSNYPVVTAARIRQTAELSPVVPKPNIKKIELEREPVKRSIDLDMSNKKVSVYKDDFESSFGGRSSDFFPGDYDTGISTEFFGSRTDLRKICYVVDASGSMQGRLGMVRKQLKDSIEKLQPDQFFYIIFFQDDRLFESGLGKMSRATSKSKAKAVGFIDSVYFQGPTNALNALEKAMNIKDSSGKSPELIYFLSDGFDLGAGDTTDFAGLIENMRKTLAPATRINTIGFWVEGRDSEILRKISLKSGGEFVNVQ